MMMSGCQQNYVAPVFAFVKGKLMTLFPKLSFPGQTPIRILCTCAFALFFLSSFSTAQQALAEPQVTLRGNTMGTYYQIKFYGLRPIDVHGKIEALLVKINQQMSTYIPDSEISRISTNASDEWQPVSKEFLEVALMSQKLFRMTRGAFDPTVGNIVGLWGFGPRYMPTRVPDTASLQKALKESGFDKIELREDQAAIRKSQPELSIDFSGIAKGYAVDQIAEYLESIGLTRYLVEIGGDLRSGQSKPDGTEWTIAVERPSAIPGEHMRVIFPRGRGLATSGDYRNYFEVDGKRYSHLINPTTGFPIANNVASVTVAAESCAEADGLATALMVLGLEKGTKVADEYGIPVLWIVRENEEFREIHNQAFEVFIKRNSVKN
ncbi:MAG: FAD:protein FMN transferase [Oligoflexus sp.]